MRLFFPLLTAVLITACASSPEAFFQLSPASTRHKAMQTRMIVSSNPKELYSASAAVLQDLGFQVEESVVDAGMLRAVKERSAREYGQEISRYFLFLVGLLGQSFIWIPVDLHQQITATLIVQPIDDSDSRFKVRIAFYRRIWKSDGASGGQSIPPGAQRMEMIWNPSLYQQFFAKLSKSVFLEINQI